MCFSGKQPAVDGARGAVRLRDFLGHGADVLQAVLRVPGAHRRQSQHRHGDVPHRIGSERDSGLYFCWTLGPGNAGRGLGNVPVHHGEHADWLGIFSEI